MLFFSASVAFGLIGGGGGGSNLFLAASNLYKIFRIVKKKGYKKIQINKIPNYGAGIAINDRISRASKF